MSEQQSDSIQSPTEIIEAVLPNGGMVRIETTAAGGERDVSFQRPQFADVMETVEGIGEAVITAMDKLQPQKASVTFGLEIGVESGHLTALIVKGTGKANLTITLEWSSSDSSAPTSSTVTP